MYSISNWHAPPLNLALISHYTSSMSNPPPPQITWPLVPNQPFYIQTTMGPAIYNYNRSTGAWCPIYATQAAQATHFPPPPQPNLLTPAVDTPSAAASSSSPSPPPSTSAMPQSMYKPSNDMVDALEAYSVRKWRMRMNLRPQKVRFQKPDAVASAQLES
eukprot:scaffold1399_cov48-Cyclotella_meneghiniana.AAC.8